MPRSDLPQPPPVAGDDELLDVLAPDGHVTGTVKRRADVHRDGDWHRAFHLWVVREDRFVLLQRRSAGKDLEAGRVDVSVGGHYAAGENLEAVLREAEEELGLVVGPAMLHPLGTSRAERHYDHAQDREFQDVYVMRHEAPLHEYRLPCDEVSVLYEAPIDGAIELFRDGTPLAVAGFDCQGRPNNALLYEPDLIEQGRTDTVEALTQIKKWLSGDSGP